MRLVHAYVNSTPLTKVAQPILEITSERTRESASLAVLDSQFVVFVARSTQRRSLSFGLGIGARLPAYCSATGRVLLAGMADEEVEFRLQRMSRRLCRSKPPKDNQGMAPLHLQLANSTLRRVIKRLHFPLEIMLVCVRWCAAYPLSLRNLEEMMAERGVTVDHATVHRWALKILPVLTAVFRTRKRSVDGSWRGLLVFSAISDGTQS